MIKRKQSYIVGIILMVLILGIGYAYLTTALNINGTTDVDANTWNVYFDNVVVESGSVSAPVPTIDTNKTTISFSSHLSIPGDYYEFTVDARNDGTIDAMIESVVKIINGNTTVPNYLKYEVTYSDDIEILPNHLLASSSKETYKVRVEYRSDINPEDLPSSGQPLTISFENIYIQADSNAVEVLHGCMSPSSDSSGGGGNASMSGLTLMMKNSTQGEDNRSWFINSAANQSQVGVYTRKGTSNDSYPIYYYRGAYQSVNNNLIFNNYCWKIVRTTATGGIRIIYNGPVNNGQCTTQTGTTTYIASTGFNSLADDAKYVGYQYDESGILTDSNLKTTLDSWYSTNMSSVDNKVESSIYCNDTQEWQDYDYENVDASVWGDHRDEGEIDFCPVFRAIKGIPTTLCRNSNDVYSLKVGFLTVDEELLAGRSWNNGMSDYLYNGNIYWLGSPARHYNGRAGEFVVNYNNTANYGVGLFNTRGVRPVVTLIKNLDYTGTGTTTDPFVVN